MFLKNYCSIFSLLILNLLIIFTFSGCIGSKHYAKKKTQSTIFLEGKTTETVLLSNKNTAWFNKGYQNYRPDKIILDSLKAKIDSTYFIVFGGTWCSDTQRELPAFLSILHQLELGSNRCEIWMLDLHKQSTYINPKIYNIEYVPTILVYKRGKEIGRIIEKPTETLEKDLLRILQNL